MPWNYPFSWVNRRGSAATASTGVAVSTTAVTFSFRNHAFVNANYRGTIFVNIAQEIPTTADSLRDQRRDPSRNQIWRCGSNYRRLVGDRNLPVMV